MRTNHAKFEYLELEQDSYATFENEINLHHRLYLRIYDYVHPFREILGLKTESNPEDNNEFSNMKLDKTPRKPKYLVEELSTPTKFFKKYMFFDFCRGRPLFIALSFFQELKKLSYKLRDVGNDLSEIEIMINQFEDRATQLASYEDAKNLKK